MRRRVVLLALAAWSLGPVRASADSISLQDGYIDSQDFGEVQFMTDYRTPDGVPYRRGLGAGSGILSHAVGWQPRDAPVYIEIGRDARGQWLLLTSLIGPDPAPISCWTVVKLTARQAVSADRLWRFVERRAAAWAAACRATSTFGAGIIAARLSEARQDFRKALNRFVSIGRPRYLKEEERVFATPSFLPSVVSQHLLDAVADECGLPRANLRLEAGGAIALRRIASAANETPNDRKVNDCASRLIAYYPGVPRR